MSRVIFKKVSKGCMSCSLSHGKEKKGKREYEGEREKFMKIKVSFLLLDPPRKSMINKGRSYKPEFRYQANISPVTLPRSLDPGSG